MMTQTVDTVTQSPSPKKPKANESGYGATFTVHGAEVIVESAEAT